MKVLTLHQPWATLFANRIKKIETRPKATSYIGTYLIHAAACFTGVQKRICQTEPFASALTETLGLKKFDQLPLGCIIGAYDHEKCELIADEIDFLCDETQELFYPSPCIYGPNEIHFGDYTPGRYAWIGENHRVLEQPIPYKNNQGYYQEFKGDESLLIFKP